MSVEPRKIRARWSNRFKLWNPLSPRNNRAGNCYICGEKLDHYDSKFINDYTLQMSCMKHMWSDLAKAVSMGFSYWTDG